MRSFIALELPDSMVGEVQALARQLRSAVPGRFMKPGTYHLTLAFLGEVDEAGARRAMEALDDACRGLGSVPLRPEGLGSFGRTSDATLWLGIAPTPELMKLARAARTALDARGIGYDAKPFKPHITLARRARLGQGELVGLVFPGEARASRATLFKSTLSPDGTRYKPLHSVRLEGKALLGTGASEAKAKLGEGPCGAGEA